VADVHDLLAARVDPRLPVGDDRLIGPALPQLADGGGRVPGRRGHRFGLIASSDHGHGASYVGAYAERLDRAAVFDALRQRRDPG